MRLVILAAGRSSRIYNQIKKNKCLLEIENQSLITKIIEDAQLNGIKKITVITGFNHKIIEEHLKKFNNSIEINFLHNNNFDTKDMMSSVILALRKYSEDLIFTYSDIYFDKDLFKKITTFNNIKNITLPINLNWKKAWDMRNKNIYADCETLVYDKNLNLTNIGNEIQSIEDVMGQFMGILCIPKKFIFETCSAYKSLKDNVKNKLHTTSFLNILIQKDFKIKCLKFDSHWYEFDDIEDFNNFNKDKI